MSSEYFEKLSEFNVAVVLFVVTKVIKTIGSVSSKIRTKSIIDANGDTLFGCDHGGC